MLDLPEKSTSYCCHVYLFLCNFPLCLQLFFIRFRWEISSCPWVILWFTTLSPYFLTLHLEIEIMTFFSYLLIVLYVVSNLECGHLSIPLNLLGIRVFPRCLITLNSPLLIGALLNIPHVLNTKNLLFCGHFSIV